MTHQENQGLIDRLDWQKCPLIPAIAQDYNDSSVLMLGFMNQEALSLTLQTHFVHYFSRSKERIWKKGEKSGHTQRLVEMFLDCDNDTLLLKVEQEGSVCHTGRETCFFNKVDFQNISLKPSCEPLDLSIQYGVLDTLYHVLQDKKNQSPQTSYTASLYAKGENGICKKIIEEAGELTFALKDKDREQIVYECADLVYHILVGLSYENINPDLIKQELKRRFSISGIEEKKNRK